MHGTIPNVVLCHGVWDLLHLGHIRHLQEAREMGDRLVVSVTSDRYANRGIGRPHFNQAQRMEAISALSCVDEVVLNDAPNAVPILWLLKPAVYVKGIDYEGSDDSNLKLEAEAVESHGGRLHVTQSAKWSSSRLLNEHRLDDEAIEFLDYARQAQYREAILSAFEHADKLKCAFVGETILDEYRYVHAIGKPSKEYTLATVHERYEQFEGGVIAASRHAEWPNVEVVTSRTITKTRFVDADFTRKLFEVYSDRRLGLDDYERGEFNFRLGCAVDEADVVVVFDFGHGLIGDSERAVIGTAKFLAVNAQSNAGNFGFNPVSRYSKADMVCVDDPEARLACGLQHDSIRTVIQSLALQMPSCKRFIVTHGRNGCLSYESSKLAKIPAFAANGVDTMGAGDAFLAVAAPLAAVGLPLEMAAFAGNVAGAIKISIVGHRRHVERNELIGTIETLLK